MTLSTNEAEYVALTHAAKEAIWLSMLRAEIFGLDCRTVCHDLCSLVTVGYTRRRDTHGSRHLASP
jgi:hypothetical protein